MRAFEEFLRYKTRIPVRGAILLNEDLDAAVLVKGWKKGANWSFPRGKINWAEDDLTCAIREVYEETGYDIEAAGLVPEDRQVKHIEISMHDQQMRLYVFRNVPMDTHFEPRTRKEISKIQWWRLSDLPAYRKRGQQQQNGPAISPNKFYMVAPFLPPLRKWVIEQKKQGSKRDMSNQYLSAGISHDEFLTEEDPEVESHIQDSSYLTSIRPRIDTLEETNEALRALLKIQPYAQGSQIGGTEVVQPTVDDNKGGALLALVQGKPRTSNQPALSIAPPHTQLEHTIIQALQSTTPHHHLPPPTDSSNLLPPSTFPIQDPSSFSYKEPNLRTNHHSSNIPVFSQNQIQTPNHSQGPHGNPHSYQNQNLVHPQPLPPHVQKAVFTGGPIHSPLVPQPIQEPFPTQAYTAKSGPLNPQFPDLHAPMVAPVQTQSQAKLNSHALALLNAFKSRDQANEPAADSHLPLQRYIEEPVQAPPPRPQELPAEVSRPTVTDPRASFGLKQPIAPSHPSQDQILHAPKLRVASEYSEEHRLGLLGLFKTAPAQAALLARANAATALPMTTTPSAVELSAVDTLSSNTARSSLAVIHSAPTKVTAKEPSVPEINPEANLPFRAMKILARPNQASDSESPKGNTSGSVKQSNGKMPVTRGEAQRSLSPEKPFQPQILKRPQFSSSKKMVPSAILNPSTSSPMHILPSGNQQRARPVANDPKQGLQFLVEKPSSSASPFLSQRDRRTTQPPEQQQRYLSIFGAPLPPKRIEDGPREDDMSPLFSIDPTLNATARSRVGSLATGDATPMSPADKGLLLSIINKGV
jgi:mRNA-decapping enzyme subunit 2